MEQLKTGPVGSNCDDGGVGVGAEASMDSSDLSRIKRRVDRLHDPTSRMGGHGRSRGRGSRAQQRETLTIIDESHRGLRVAIRVEEGETVGAEVGDHRDHVGSTSYPTLEMSLLPDERSGQPTITGGTCAGASTIAGGGGARG
ncbi:hypothetical protein ZWY2020_020502 [Hordeum vulgare]|nr:hypothetical protein ZWY2020_020502 [Hordeum vulgare]